jgi:hypothetical protein
MDSRVIISEPAATSIARQRCVISSSRTGMLPAVGAVVSYGTKPWIAADDENGPNVIAAVFEAPPPVHEAHRTALSAADGQFGGASEPATDVSAATRPPIATLAVAPLAFPAPNPASIFRIAPRY